MSDDHYAEPDWDAVFQTPLLREAFESERDGVTLLWSPLRAAAEEEHNPRAKEALETLSAIASLYIVPDDWNIGYGPMFQMGEQRSLIPTDLTTDTLLLLQEVVEHVPHALLRARIHDVLALRVTGHDRMEHVRAHLTGLVNVGINSERWFGERDMWHRAIHTARRFGKATSKELADLEQQLLRNLLEETPDNYFQAQLADALAQHGLGRMKTNDIATRLRAIGDSFSNEPDKARFYYGAAGGWFGTSGDKDARGESYKVVIESYITEGESLATEAGGNFARAGYLFELALKELQKLSRVDREKLGLADTAALLARRIREVGAAGLGSMQRFESDPVDLSEAVEQSRRQISGLEPDRALLAFTSLERFAPYDKDRADAEALLKRHPFSALFSTTIYSADGRIVKRSEGTGGAPVFGVDPAVWRQMVQSHVLRIQLVVTGRLWPAFEMLTNEHHLTMGDFIVITASSSIVPLDHVRQFARGLYYGYIGDFSTAAQLLTLQIEHLVRHHLNNAGILTTTRTPEGIENEKGISSLLDDNNVDEIFGTDLAYELRVLFSDATGPNLRNEVAHGLLVDTIAEGATSLYAWWLALKIVYLQFWNRSRRAEARNESEPSSSSEDDPAIRVDDGDAS